MAEIETLIQEFEERLDQLAAFLDRLRAATRAQSQAQKNQAEGNLGDLMRPGQAVKFFKLSRSSLFRMCVKHPVGTPGGFSFQDENGDYLISKSGLALHLQRYPPRKRRPKKR